MPQSALSNGVERLLPTVRLTVEADVVGAPTQISKSTLRQSKLLTMLQFSFQINQDKKPVTT